MEIVPHKLIDSTTCAKLDISDLDIPNKDKIDHLLVFQIATYTKLKKVSTRNYMGNNDSAWHKTFASVNRFLGGLDQHDKTAIAQTIILIHSEIIDFFQKDDLLQINSFMRAMGEHIDNLDKATNLCDKLKDYVVNNMVIGVYKGAGKRAQDSSILTFTPDHVVDLTTIALLCKMLSPLFGVIMKGLDKKIESKLKETHCVAMLNQLLQRKYKTLIEKLQYYITHVIKQCIEETTSSLMHGFNISTLSFYMYTILLARQFVNVDLGIKNGNLITYIFVNIKRAMTTIKSSILQKPTYNRKPMSSTHDDDDGNVAQIEIDSLVSRKTMDVPALVMAAIPKTIEMYLNQFSIDVEEYEAVTKHYIEKSPIIPNPINKDLNSMFYGKDIGGGQGILMLHGLDYIRITTLLQMILLTTDVNYIPLAHMLTASPSTSTILTISNNPNILKLNAGSSQAYKSCRQRFENSPYGARGKEWDNHINQLADHLVTNVYIYNTSPWLWNWLETDNLNGKRMEVDDKIITGLCSFYDFLCSIGNM